MIAVLVCFPLRSANIAFIRVAFVDISMMTFWFSAETEKGTGCGWCVNRRFRT